MSHDQVVVLSLNCKRASAFYGMSKARGGLARGAKPPQPQKCRVRCRSSNAKVDRRRVAANSRLDSWILLPRRERSTLKQRHRVQPTGARRGEKKN